MDRGLRARASTLGTVLRTSDDPALRSAAAGLLPEAGSATKFMATGAFRRVAGALPFVGFGLGVVSNVAEGQPLPEAALRSGVDTGAGVLGAAGGIAVCGAVGIATAGIGGLVCAVFVVGGSVVASIGADHALDMVIGPPTIHDDH